MNNRWGLSTRTNFRQIMMKLRLGFHERRLLLSKQVLFTAVCALCINTVLSSSAAACEQIEIVPYPESYGWAINCTSYGQYCGYDWATAARQLSPMQVCSEMAGPVLAKLSDGSPVCSWPEFINTQGVADSGHIYYLSQTPFCHDPDTGQDSPIYTGPWWPSTPGFCWTVRCADHPDVIKLFPVYGSAESTAVLTSIEPGKSTNFIAQVYDQNNQLVPNVGIRLVLEARQNSGGHHHGDDTVAARTGTLAGQQARTGNTGANGGGFSFTYNAPGVAGDYKITASCTDGKNCKQEGADTVWVGHKGLQPLNDNSVYILLPNDNDPQHPDNHDLTLAAASRMAVFAALYHGKYPDLSVLQLNDASLERGGIFDLRHNWKTPHHEHCGGTAIDIRANGANGALDITGDGVHMTDDGTVHPVDPMIDKLQTIARVAGADAVWEVPKDSSGNFVWNTRHFHTRLIGQEGLTCP